MGYSVVDVDAGDGVVVVVEDDAHDVHHVLDVEDDSVVDEDVAFSHSGVVDEDDDWGLHGVCHDSVDEDPLGVGVDEDGGRGSSSLSGVSGVTAEGGGVGTWGDTSANTLLIVLISGYFNP